MEQKVKKTAFLLTLEWTPTPSTLLACTGNLLPGTQVEKSPKMGGGHYSCASLENGEGVNSNDSQRSLVDVKA